MNSDLSKGRYFLVEEMVELIQNYGFIR